MDIGHILKVDSYHLASEIESCSTEIGEYLSQHSNWPQPIFPGVDGCSPLLFEPQRFDVIGSYWNCDNQVVQGNIAFIFCS